MCRSFTLFGMTLYPYALLLIAGAMLCFVLLLFVTLRRHKDCLNENLFALVAFVVVALLSLGGAAVLDALLKWVERGAFELRGATFYGGLIGGAGAFLLVYFIAGKHFCKDNEAVKRFPDMLDIGACCIPLAHAFGRLGCLTAGCCHGRETDAWYGINMYNYTNGAGEEVWHRVVPIQLFESIFLFALAAVLIVLFFKNRGKHKFPLMPLYCVGYGIWRFFIEFARADDRGNTFIPFLTPSQLVAVLLIAVGVVYFLLWFFKWRKTPPQTDKNGQNGQNDRSA